MKKIIRNTATGLLTVAFIAIIVIGIFAYDPTLLKSGAVLFTCSAILKVSLS